MDIYEEAQILDRCRAGDLGAYRRIYERYEQPLLRTACRLLGRREEAEDAVQETFLKLYRGIAGVRGQATFSSYLFRILINTCNDMLRSRKHADFANVDVADLPLAGPAVDDGIIARTIDRLPNRMKACFVLNAVEEFTLQEVADMLGVNIGSVKKSVHRARQKLRAWLEPEPAGEKS